MMILIQHQQYVTDKLYLYILALRGHFYTLLLKVECVALMAGNGIKYAEYAFSYRK